MNYRCPVKGCQELLPGPLSPVCAGHWAELPSTLQRQIVEARRKRKEAEVAALREAVDFLNEQKNTQK